MGTYELQAGRDSCPARREKKCLSATADSVHHGRVDPEEKSADESGGETKGMETKGGDRTGGEALRMKVEEKVKDIRFDKGMR